MEKPYSILLIDDDQDNNFLNQRLFSKMGIADQVKVLLNGKIAFQYLSNISQENYNNNDADNFKPNLILLDLNMPVMDGFEFLELYYTLPEAFRRDIKIALLSTSEHPQDIERTSKFNLPYLTKPLSAEKINNVLQQLEGSE